MEILFFLILYPVIGLFLLAVCVAAYLIPHAKAAILKEKREQAKLEVDQLRKQRLERDLAVVEARAHLVTSQEVLVGLRIEEKRRELGLGSSIWTPEE